MDLPDKVRDIEDLREAEAVFDDRQHAGERLAEIMKPESGASRLVLGVPAGGVPVAMVVARTLELPLDVAVISKITVPGNPEAGIGAIGFDGTVRLNEALIERQKLTPEQVQRQVDQTRKKVQRRVRELRGHQSPLRLDGRTAILVDDGVASGFTIRVGVEAALNAGAGEVVVATPTGHLAALKKIAEQVERIYCANVRSGYPFAVAAAYKNWRDVAEEEIYDMLPDRDDPSTSQRL